MDLKLSGKDIQALENIKSRSKVIRYLENIDKLKFNIGDVLIKYEQTYEGGNEYSWQVETTHEENALPRRYVCVHKDELGVSYVKRLKVSDGRLGDELICLADADLDNERYEIDPLFLDMVLFGEGTFNIKELQKKELKRKKEIIEFNKKSCQIATKVSEANKILSTLKAGSRYWIDGGENYLGTSLTEVEVVGVKCRYISRLPEDERDFYVDQINDKLTCDEKKIYILDVINCGYDDSVNSFDILNQHIYMNKPVSLVEKQ